MTPREPNHGAHRARTVEHWQSDCCLRVDSLSARFDVTGFVCLQVAGLHWLLLDLGHARHSLAMRHTSNDRYYVGWYVMRSRQVQVFTPLYMHRAGNSAQPRD